MLGTDLTHAFTGHQVTAAGRDKLDITDAEDARRAVAGMDVVINAAAYTNVDAAETEEDTAHRINADGAENLAAAARNVGARLVQISTDYVFDGTATTPYDEHHPLAPVSAYGRSKADGERRALTAHPDGTYVVRTAWLYGENGGNFPATMLRLAATHPTVDVVTDQTGQPTLTRDLARQIRLLVESDAPAGIYHGTNSGTATWYEFARAVYTECGLDPDRIHPTDSTAFIRPAPRPAYSVLGHNAWSRAGLPEMRNWRDALHDAVTTGAISIP